MNLCPPKSNSHHCICLTFRISPSESDQVEMRIVGSSSSNAADPEMCELKRPVVCLTTGPTHNASAMAASNTKFLTLFQSPLILPCCPSRLCQPRVLTFHRAILHFQVPISRGWEKGDSDLCKSGMFGNPVDCGTVEGRNDD